MIPEGFSPELKEAITKPTDGSKEKVSVVTITPEEAYEIVHTMGYERQRKLNLSHVGMIADSMSNDAFVRCREITFSPDENGEPVLIDGQHRLNAAITAEWTGKWIVCCLWGEQDEAEKDYIRLDTSQKERTASVIGKSIPEYEHMSGRMRASIVGAARYMCSWSTEYQTPPLCNIPPNRDCTELIDRRMTAFEKADEIVNAPSVRAHIKPRLTMPMVVAIMVETLHQMPQEAEGFWKSVAIAGQGIAADLNALLLAGKPPKSSAYYMGRLAAHGWNQRASNRNLRRDPRSILKVSRTDLVVPT